MKIKGLLLGMLACAAMASCTNNDLVEEENGKQEVKAPAFVSLAIASSTGGSRANTENPAEPENTDISNVGTEAENAVNSLAFVILDTDGKVEVSKTFDQAAFTEAFTLNNATGTYEQNTANEKAYKVAAGDKKVIVVLNPTTTLLGKNGESLYKEIIEGTYNTLPSYANSDAIMMANRELAYVTATTANTENNPAIAAVDVERSVAKVMFKPTNDNQYAMTITTHKEVESKKTINGTEYFVGTDAEGKTFYFTTKEEVEGDVTKTVVDKALNENEQEAQYWDGKGATPSTPYYTGNLTKVKTDNVTKNNITVTLTDYLLSNDQKASYNVRHISTNGTTSVAFGSLTGSNYLYDCFFNLKNATTLANPNYDYTTMFTTPYVKATATSVFSPLPSTPENIKNEGDANYTACFMAYLFENAAVRDMQKHAFSTTITFKAKASYKDGTPFEGYVYNGTIYANKEDLKSSNSELSKRTDSELAKTEGLGHYVNGICYYSTQLKHFDNGMPSSMGIMEFAVVRNNIYSLEVESISGDGENGGLGDPEVFPTTPETDDESGDAYIKISVNKIPWIVRYNKIKF